MSSNSNNRVNAPARMDALEEMKVEVARELGVNLANGYNGNLSARENGQVGGQMVRRMIEDYERQAGRRAR